MPGKSVKARRGRFAPRGAGKVGDAARQTEKKKNGERLFYEADGDMDPEERTGAGIRRFHRSRHHHIYFIYINLK